MLHGRYDAGAAVEPVGARARVPGYVAPKKGAACGAGTLAGDQGELGGGLG